MTMCRRVSLALAFKRLSGFVLDSYWQELKSMLDRLETKYARTQGVAPSVLSDALGTQSATVRIVFFLACLVQAGPQATYSFSSLFGYQVLANSPLAAIKDAFKPASTTDDPEVACARASTQHCYTTSLY